MGLLSSLQKRYQAMKIGQVAMYEGVGFKSSRSGNILSEIAKMLQPQWAEPPQKDIKDWLQLFIDSPRLDPVHKIAEDVASAEWGLYKKLGNGEKEKVEEHPLIDLFKKPNPLPESTWFTLLYMTEAYLCITGEAFWVIERSGLKQITEIWIIPPNWVQSIPTVGQDYYEVQTADGVRLNIAAEDMIYFKEPNLVNPYGRGRGRAKAIEDEIETDEYMAKWAKKFFYNDARPPFLIEAPGAGKADVDRLQESWMQRFSGLKNAHKPAVLPFQGKVHQLGTNAREMDFVQSRKYLRDQSNQHFRVPPELMGIIENSNRATIDAADYIYRSSVLINRLTMIEHVIQYQIINKFFENENLVFEFENVIPEDKQFELTVANEGLSRGAISINEWRQKNGFDPLPGDMGDVYLIPNTHTPVRNPAEAFMMISPTNQNPNQPNPASPQPNEPTQPTEPNNKPDEQDEEDGTGKSVKKSVNKDIKILNWKEGYTDDQLVELSRLFESTLDDLEKEHAKAVMKFLKAQGKRFAKYVEGLDIKEVIEIVETKDESDNNDDNSQEAEDKADEIIAGYDWIDEQGMLLEGMTPHMMAAAEAGNSLVNGIFELGVSFSLIRDEMLEHIKTHGLEKVVGITNTTINLLREQLVEGLKKGESSVKLAKRIRETSSEYAYRRSFVIARTESHNTMVAGTFKTYEQAGVPKKQWLTVLDGRERKSHHDIHGEIKNREEPFSNGLMYPGDASGPAEEVINCRCALLPAWE
jgi:HK97 family phage portal protein